MKRLKDRITDHSEPYDDTRLYPAQTHECSEATKDRALDAAETLLALVAAGKLDATDLRIIEERSRSPMPSLREVAAVIGCGVATVHERTEHIKALMVGYLRVEISKKPNNPSL